MLPVLICRSGFALLIRVATLILQAMFRPTFLTSANARNADAGYLSLRGPPCLAIEGGFSPPL